MGSQSVNDWCLSNLGFKKMGLIQHDVNDQKGHFDDVAVIGDSGHLFTIKLKTGSVNWKYELPTIPKEKTPAYLTSDSLETEAAEQSVGEKSVPAIFEIFKLPSGKPIDVLSQVEIETCKPYVFAHKQKRVYFSNFEIPQKFDSDEDLTTFGHDIVGCFKQLKVGKKSHMKIKFQQDFTTCPEADVKDTQTTVDGNYAGLQDIRKAMEGSLIT
ncbi:unnamed protein product [Ambrosiozyma monospora]|uniref:Unnamed protein product n=1 Tax=Ambrosiozyma monospora TaxID=43982 RepID=A0ACB5SVR7_AMBMO|nr:unnamed protein product [Ambrosiozyma monospora]